MLPGFPITQAVARSMTAGASLPSRASLPLDRCGDNETQEDYLIERATLLFLIQPPLAWPESKLWPSTEAHALWTALMDLTGHTIVAAEVGYSDIDCVVTQCSRCSPCRLL